MLFLSIVTYLGETKSLEARMWHTLLMECVFVWLYIRGFCWHNKFAWQESHPPPALKWRPRDWMHDTWFEHHACPTKPCVEMPAANEHIMYHEVACCTPLLFVYPSQSEFATIAIWTPPSDAPCQVHRIPWMLFPTLNRSAWLLGPCLILSLRL